MSRRFFFPRPIPVVFFLSLLGLAIYSNSFDGQFCSDDAMFIQNNHAIRHLGNFAEMGRYFHTRFLLGMSFAVNYSIGGLNVVGYHLVNVIIHILNAILVYFLVILTLQTPEARKITLKSSPQGLAFMAALIFLCHPVQVEGVSFISQRGTSMGTMFYLASIVFYIRGRLVNSGKKYRLALLSMLGGILTKEMTITIPLTLMVYELLFWGWPAARERTAAVRRLLPFYGLSVLLAAFFFLESRGSMLGLKAQLANAFSFSHFLTELNVLRTYLRMFILPVGLNHDYQFPLAKGLFQWEVLFSIGLLAGFFLLGVRQIRRHRLLAFAVFWFFITTSVEAVTVCFVQKGVIYDHWLYLPMTGLAIFLSSLFDRILPSRNLRNMIGGVCIMTLCLMTYQRNFVWKDEFSLWRDVLRKSPDNFRALTNLGVLLSREGEIEKSLAHYERAWSLAKGKDAATRAQILINWGAAQGKRGEYEKEIELNKRAIEIYPAHAQAYSNAGYAFALLEDFTQARIYGHQAVERDPYFAEGYNNLGVIYALEGNLNEAVIYFEKALALMPDFEKARQNLSIARQRLLTL